MTINRRDFLAYSAGAAATGLVASALRAQAEAARSAPVYLRGHYAPTFEEITAGTLTVTGRIPPALTGRYFRNGHNPKPEVTPPCWFYGSGMIHGIRLRDGRAEWYRNRWVRTPYLDGVPYIGKDGRPNLAASVAGTHVIAHGGRILALCEVAMPYEVSPELETVGLHDFGGKLKTPMCAHPRRSPTGELHFFAASPFPPYLVHHVAAADGTLLRSHAVSGPGPSLIHDFAVTPNYVVWVDPSVVFDKVMKSAFPYRWDDKYPTRIGIMPRNGDGKAVSWFEVEPSYVFHIANVHEDAAGRIIVEGPSFDRAAWDYTSQWVLSAPGVAALPARGPRHHRWTVDLTAGSARREQLDALSVEFPTVNEAYWGRPNRYSYAVAFPGAGLSGCAIVKYDSRSGTAALHETRPGLFPGEAVFVAAPDGKAEDEGWLMTFVSDAERRKSALWILDATNLAAPPVATIEIPGWVPAGVHGSWIPDSALR